MPINLQVVGIYAGTLVYPDYSFADQPKNVGEVTCYEQGNASNVVSITGSVACDCN